MTQDDVLGCDLLDEVTLTLDELARVCAVEPGWIVERVEAGILCTASGGEIACWHFVSADLARARQLLALERDFDADPQLAALVVDLIEEVRHLRNRLRVAGVA